MATFITSLKPTSTARFVSALEKSIQAFKKIVVRTSDLDDLDGNSSCSFYLEVADGNLSLHLCPIGVRRGELLYDAPKISGKAIYNIISGAGFTLKKAFSGRAGLSIQFTLSQSDVHAALDSIRVAKWSPGDEIMFVERFHDAPPDLTRDELVDSGHNSTVGIYAGQSCLVTASGVNQLDLDISICEQAAISDAAGLLESATDKFDYQAVEELLRIHSKSHLGNTQNGSPYGQVGDGYTAVDIDGGIGEWIPDMVSMSCFESLIASGIVNRKSLRTSPCFIASTKSQSVVGVAHKEFTCMFFTQLEAPMESRNRHPRVDFNQLSIAITPDQLRQIHDCLKEGSRLEADDVRILAVVRENLKVAVYDFWFKDGKTASLLRKNPITLDDAKSGVTATDYMFAVSKDELLSWSGYDEIVLAAKEFSPMPDWPNIDRLVTDFERSFLISKIVVGRKFTASYNKKRKVKYGYGVQV